MLSGCDWKAPVRHAMAVRGLEWSGKARFAPTVLGVEWLVSVGIGESWIAFARLGTDRKAQARCALVVSG